MTNFDEAILARTANHEPAFRTLDNLIAVARPERVYGAALSVGDYTIVPAAEVTAACGFGYGSGGGSSPEPVGEPRTNGNAETRTAAGSGSGGGGGGSTIARPVAVISVGPAGVRVEPVVDVTKVALVLFATLGTLFVALRKLGRR